MDDFTLTLRSSVIWLLFLLCYYLAAVVYIVWQPFYTWIAAVLLLAVCGLATIDFRRWRRQQQSCLSIKLHQQRWFVSVDSTTAWEPVTVQCYFNSPLLLILYCMPSGVGKNRYYYCWRDSLTAANWRALQSYLAIYS
jgi:hypothetical protein